LRDGGPATWVDPGTFSAADASYPQVLALQPHPEVELFFGLPRSELVARYCERHPSTDAAELARLLGGHCRHLRWAGSDLLLVRGADDRRRMIVLETNSCPSGQKSMPLLASRDRRGGYLRVAEALFNAEDAGTTAVVYDKNPMEAFGYARTLADHLQRPVPVARFGVDDPGAAVRFREGVMQVRDETGRWHGVNRAFRYVTQRPWARLPVRTHTAIVNPVVACLAGGRNKLVAHKAYERLSSALHGAGLEVRTPLTFAGVELGDVRDAVAALGGQAVVKVPYSNAGQGMHIVTDRAELATFEAGPHGYDRFVVQELVGDLPASAGSPTRHVQLGTCPDHQGRRFAFDLRMLVCSGPRGFEPVAAYARRAPEPLDSGAPASRRFATNLSGRNAGGAWTLDDSRLVPLGAAGFELLGLSLDDLIDAYVQTVLSVWAIEQMSRSLLDEHGDFSRQAFLAENGDDALLGELLGDSGP
jgi:hypothetical protein